MNFNINSIMKFLYFISSCILPFIAIYISAKALKQNNELQIETQKANLETRKANFESQKANIVFSLDRSRTDLIFKANETIRLTIKNYGNSPGTITNMYTSPSKEELSKLLTESYEDAQEREWYKRNLCLLTSKNITLVPGQYLITYLPLDLFKDDIFEVTINYSTLNHDFTFNEKFDLDYRKSLSLENPKFSKNTSNETDPTLKALSFIGESIREVSDKLS
ncbi:MAG: hypothetical protein E6094_06775 [Clostridium perfringens]|nr:hypothetical protein [Clostridium perfringens]